MMLEEMTMEEYKKGLEKTRTLVVPYGTIEAHGAHLPVNTDTLVIERVIRKAAESVPVFVAPPVHYGVCTSTGAHPGSIGITAETLRRITLDIVRDGYGKGLNNFALISGHGPQNADGSIAEPLGKLGRNITVEQGYAAARLTGLSILGSLQRTLGDLDRITSWVRVFGMVNSGPGFNQQPSVINGFSDLILELWGPDAGAHSRSAVGMAELPFDIPVEIEGEVEILA